MNYINFKKGAKMKIKYIFLILIILPFFLTSCLGGKEEEEVSRELNISGGAELAELEQLQKLVKEQKDQLRMLEAKLKEKKTSGSSKEEIQALKKEITKQKTALIEVSKKAETVTSVKGQYVWQMFRGVPSHDFYTGLNILPPLDFKWRFRAGAGFEASPVMGKTNIYIGSLDNNFYAIDKKSGQLVWKVPSQGAISSTAALYGGVLYYGTETGMMFAVKADDGKVIWKVRLGGPIKLSSPAVFSKIVIVGCMDNNVYALDRGTGEIVWKHSAFMPVASSPTIANGMVYIGSIDKTLYALDVDSGSVQWQFQAGNAISSTPAEHNATLYFGSDDKKIYALDSLNGSLKWTFPTDGWVASSPVIKDGILYVGSNDKFVYALNAENGKLLWKTETGGKVLTVPFIVNNIIYIASGKDLLALDIKTGEKKWEQKYDYTLKSSLIGEDGVIYFADSDSSVIALESVAK